MLHKKLSFLGEEYFDIPSRISQGWALKADEYPKPYWTIFDHRLENSDRAFNLNSSETAVYRSFESFRAGVTPQGIGAHESHYLHNSPAGHGPLCGAYWIVIVGKNGILGSKFLATRQHSDGVHYPTPAETEFFELLKEHIEDIGHPRDAHLFFFVERDTLAYGHLKDANYQINKLKRMGFEAIAYAPVGRPTEDWGPNPDDKTYWASYFCIRPDFRMFEMRGNKLIIDDQFQWVLDYDGDIIVVGPKMDIPFTWTKPDIGSCL